MDKEKLKIITSSLAKNFNLAQDIYKDLSVFENKLSDIKDCEMLNKTLETVVDAITGIGDALDYFDELYN